MKQPAIILITCDELRRDTLSCWGNEAISTPHIDSLAARGTRYENCYTVSPWCLPARCSILTSLYPHRSGAYSNFRPCPLDEGVDNIFTLLKAGSYRTSLFGKCHFAPVPYDQTVPDRTLPYDDFRDYYRRLGIDHLALQDDKNVSIWFYDDYSKALDAAGHLKAVRDVNWDRSRQAIYSHPAPEGWHPDLWVGRHAAKALRQADPDQPAFTWISFSGPHYPFDTPEGYYDRVDASKLRPMARREGEWDDPGRIHYASFHGGGNIDGAGHAPDRACKNYTEDYWQRLRVSYNANMCLIDDMVGEILAAAKETYGEDCLILFTADHGEMLGDHSLWGKHNCAYDPVWRIPLLVRTPGQEGACASPAMVNLNDLLPTCLSAAGLPLPEGIDGAPLSQREAEGGLAYTFAEGEGYAAVTDGRLKYVHIQKPREGEYYRELLDPAADPGEFENRIADPAYSADLSRLREKLIEHFMQTTLP